MTPIYGRLICHALTVTAVTVRDTLDDVPFYCHDLAVTAVTVRDTFSANLLCKIPTVTAVTASRHSGAKSKYVGKSDESAKYIHLTVSIGKQP